MFKKKDSEKKRIGLTGELAVKISMIASPVLRALYYVFIVAILLSAIIAIIMLFVNAEVDKMLLPPYMAKIEAGHTITIGNGIRIDAVGVTTWDIKVVVWAELLLFGATCMILAPISLFLSKLLKSVGKRDLDNVKNSRYMMYVGLTVAVGYTFIGMAHDFYNYLLVRTFVESPETIHLSMRPDFGGILVGFLIIFFAKIYATLCEKKPEPAEKLPAQSNQ